MLPICLAVMVILISSPSLAADTDPTRPFGLSGLGNNNQSKHEDVFTLSSIIHGEGIHGRFNDADLIAGNSKLLARFNINLTEQLAIHAVNVDQDQNIIYVCYQHTLIGYFVIADQLRPESKEAIEIFIN